jgi:hypothetical protein
MTAMDQKVSKPVAVMPKPPKQELKQTFLEPFSLRQLIEALLKVAVEMAMGTQCCPEYDESQPHP